MKLIVFLKYLILGILLLFLFHFESLSIGQFKISHLWKGVALVFLILSISKRKQKTVFIYKPLLFLSVLQILNLELIINPLNAILLFGTTLIIPILGIYLLKYSLDELKNGILFFASFFIFSFIPYKLGVLTSLGKAYDLSKYGAASGLVGPYQGAHAASFALAGSFLVLLYFLFTKAFNRFYLASLLVLCFYFLINTFVRSGLAMVVLGSVPMFFYFIKKHHVTRIRLISIGGVLAILTSFWVLNNEVLLNRILGKDKYRTEQSIEEVGSGRGMIYLTHINILTEANFFEYALGMGQTELIKRTKLKIGKGLLSHNAFLQLLLSNGIFGLVMLFMFIKKIYKLKKLLHKEHFVLILSLLFAFVVMSFVQNYDNLYFHIIMMLSITLYSKESFYRKIFVSEKSENN